MPTDQVLTLIAEMRAKADAMPAGPYGPPTEDLEGGRIYWIQPHYPEMIAVMGEEHHAAYFASFDPALVRALLDVVEALYIDWNTSADDHEGGMRAAENLSIQAGAGFDTLEALAADRVAS